MCHVWHSKILICVTWDILRFWYVSHVTYYNSEVVYRVLNVVCLKWWFLYYVCVCTMLQSHSKFAWFWNLKNYKFFNFEPRKIHDWKLRHNSKKTQKLCRIVAKQAWKFAKISMFWSLKPFISCNTPKKIFHVKKKFSVLQSLSKFAWF